VVEAAILHRHALYHREVIVAAMRELAHQELSMLSPRLQLRCGGSVRAIQRAIWDIYPPTKVVSPKVKAFLAFLAQPFGHPAYRDLP
jgi:hypothetical protein